MKNTVVSLGLSVLLAIVGLAHVGCGGDSPAKVVTRYHEAYEKADLKTLAELMEPGEMKTMYEKYATSDSPDDVKNREQLIEMLKELAAIDKRGGIASTAETINGDSAEVEITWKNGDTSKSKLVKIDGKWKAKVS